MLAAWAACSGCRDDESDPTPDENAAASEDTAPSAATGIDAAPTGPAVVERVSLRAPRAHPVPGPALEVEVAVRERVGTARVSAATYCETGAGVILDAHDVYVKPTPGVATLEVGEQPERGAEPGRCELHLAYARGYGDRDRRALGSYCAGGAEVSAGPCDPPLRGAVIPEEAVELVEVEVDVPPHHSLGVGYTLRFREANENGPAVFVEARCRFGKRVLVDAGGGTSPDLGDFGLHPGDTVEGNARLFVRPDPPAKPEVCDIRLRVAPDRVRSRDDYEMIDLCYRDGDVSAGPCGEAPGRARTVDELSKDAVRVEDFRAARDGPSVTVNAILRSRAPVTPNARVAARVRCAYGGRTVQSDLETASGPWLERLLSGERGAYEATAYLFDLPRDESVDWCEIDFGLREWHSKKMDALLLTACMRGDRVRRTGC